MVNNKSITNWLFSNSTLIAIGVIQLALCYYAFYNILSYPNKYVFNSVYDGIKNYYVVASYVQQNINVDLLHFNGYNYPYGDSIFFIDNSPIFSVFYRILVKANLADGARVIYYYNLFFILCTFFSSIVAYKIVKKITSNTFFIIAISISTPWISQQIHRLSLGHFNLSVSLYLLLSILILMNIYKSYSENKIYYKQFLALVLLIFVSSFTHLYYFPIIIIIASLFLGILSIESFYKNKENKYKFGLFSFLSIGISIIGVYSILILFDQYSAERLPSAGGYNWSEWKFNFFTLIRPNDYNYVKFLISSTKRIPFESYSYIGAGSLFILTLIVILLFFKKERSSIYTFIKGHTYAKFFLYFTITVFICFNISIGPEYYFMDNEYYLTNYLNPFFYLADLFPIFKQFRCLARFSWPLILFLQISLALFLSYLYQKKILFKIAAVIFMTLNLANAYETVKYFNLTYYENPLEKRNLSPELKEMLGIINNPSKEYQSILTIPFYHCGSEDYNYTIDPDDQFATTSMQLSYFSKLPLMSSKMGRTSIIQTKNLFNIYLNKTIPLEILSNFNSKKILVFVDRGFYNGKKTWPFNDKEPASTVIKTSIELLDSTNCNKIYSVNDLELYEMTINN